jgi:hypothetical protein
VAGFGLGHYLNRFAANLGSHHQSCRISPEAPTQAHQEGRPERLLLAPPWSTVSKSRSSLADITFLFPSTLSHLGEGTDLDLL